MSAAKATAKPGAKATRRKRAYHHGDLRRALVGAARAILEKGGLGALSLRAVARRAGVSQAAPYHHFADRDALVSAVATEGFREFDAAMHARMDRSRDPVERLIAAGVAYVSFAVANPALFQVMFGATMQKLPDDPERLEAGACTYVTLEGAVAGAMAARGRDPANVPLACLLAWSIVHGLAKLLIEGDLDPATYGAKNAEDLAERLLPLTWIPGT